MSYHLFSGDTIRTGNRFRSVSSPVFPHPVSFSLKERMTGTGMLSFEIQAEQKGFRSISGVDEAGRGPLAGPVVAAAVVLPAKVSLNGLTDSKQLSEAAREDFFPRIRQCALGYGIGIVGEETIDAINILQASLLAMRIAVEKLPLRPDLLLIDGNRRIDHPSDQWPIVRGDAQSLSIAAASVLAKVTRDRIMTDHHATYPQYAFDKHKGYGTRAHRESIRRHGPCPIHRKSFKGVREFIEAPAASTGERPL